MNDSKKQVKGFFLFFEQYESIKLLSNEQKGMLLEAMFTKFADKEHEITDPVVAMAFSFMERGFQQEKEKYFQICERRKENAKKRWDKDDANACSGDAKNANACKCISDDANACKPMQTMLKPELELKLELKPDNNNFIMGQKAPTTTTTTKRFIPPLPEDVDAYCQEKGYAINGQSFCDYYEARGWMLGKVKMKNWKAAVATWVRNENSTPNANRPKPWEVKQQQEIDRYQKLCKEVGW